VDISIPPHQAKRSAGALPPGWSYGSNTAVEQAMINLLVITMMMLAV
jgi:hypothetical protein